MNWDDYSDEDEEVNIKPENSKPIKVEETRQTNIVRKFEDQSNDIKRTNSASTKCTHSSFGNNKKYLKITQ
jgi:hypothetical protein